MSVRDVRQGFEDYIGWATDPTPRIGMGLPFFDGPTRGGIAKSECAMFMAYSSVGKTTLALHMIAENPGIPTYFASLEMSWRQVVAGLGAITTGTPTWELEELAKNQRTELLAATAQRYPLLFGNDRSEQTFKTMAEDIQAAGQKAGQPIRLVFIDYLELIGGAGLLGKSEQVDKAAQKVRALAKDTDTSVVVLHQVGKGDGSAGHEPLALDSGKYGGHHPMDYVVGMYAPRLNRKKTQFEREQVGEELWLQLLKNRSGQAEPDGVRHHLSKNTRRISQWGDQFRPATTGVPPHQATLYVPSRPEPELEDVA